MPTVHVAPGAELLLQDIANALHKAKKVVVVTGAGISTNSGIPVSRTRHEMAERWEAKMLTCVTGLPLGEWSLFFDPGSV